METKPFCISEPQGAQATGVSWRKPSDTEHEQGIRIILGHGSGVWGVVHVRVVGGVECKWLSCATIGIKLTQTLYGTDVITCTWHGKGDYVATVTREATKSVLIHQLSKRRSQAPFKKSKGDVQSVLFHPTRPFFLVAVRVFLDVAHRVWYLISSRKV